jgi:hypothetical protein
MKSGATSPFASLVSVQLAGNLIEKNMSAGRAGSPLYAAVANLRFYCTKAARTK